MAKTTFVDGNKALNIRGTMVDAAFLNAVNNHRHDGADVDGAGAIDYAPDTGAADAYAIALIPALTDHVTGLPISFKALHTNTGPATIAVNGLTPVALRKYGNAALEAGDIVAGQMNVIVFDGTYYQLLPGMVAALAGSATQAFSAADGGSGKQVVNISQFVNSFSGTGYAVLPGGLVLQWGSYIPVPGGALPGDTIHSITWPLAYPTACLWALAALSNSAAYINTPNLAMETVDFFQTYGRFMADATGAGSQPNDGFYWISIGH